MGKYPRNTTPGPWIAEHGDPNVPGRMSVIRADCAPGDNPYATYIEVCVCRIDTRHPSGAIGTREGNATLIAAAPEMYEVLCEVADYWAGGDVPEELDDRMRDLLWRIQGARVPKRHPSTPTTQAANPCHDETGHLRASEA